MTQRHIPGFEGTKEATFPFGELWVWIGFLPVGILAYLVFLGIDFAIFQVAERIRTSNLAYADDRILYIGCFVLTCAILAICLLVLYIIYMCVIEYLFVRLPHFDPSLKDTRESQYRDRLRTDDINTHVAQTCFWIGVFTLLFYWLRLSYQFGPAFPALIQTVTLYIFLAVFFKNDYLTSQVHMLLIVEGGEMQQKDLAKTRAERAKNELSQLRAYYYKHRLLIENTLSFDEFNKLIDEFVSTDKNPDHHFADFAGKMRLRIDKIFYDAAMEEIRGPIRRAAEEEERENERQAEEERLKNEQVELERVEQQRAEAERRLRAEIDAEVRQITEKGRKQLIPTEIVEQEIDHHLTARGPAWGLSPQQVADELSRVLALFKQHDHPFTATGIPAARQETS